MARAKRRKGTSFENKKTKSIFLYGTPNVKKADILSGMQSSFLALVNDDIRLLDARDDIALQVIKNDKKDSAMRALEKSIRPKGVNSAFCQNAFDTAVTHLSNRMESIRKEMLADNRTVLTRSKVLFAMAVSGCGRDAMISEMRSISKKKDDFYSRCAAELDSMDEAVFRTEMAAMADSYAMYRMEYRVPELRSAEVPLDSRLMKIEESSVIKAPFVITVTDPFKKKNRIMVPLNTSSHSLHKAKSNKMAGTVKASIRNGKLRIAWSYDKSLEQPKTSNITGVDVGIIDAIHTSDNAVHGSMKEVLDFYKDTVEPAFAGLSDLRNKKKAISHYLRRHKPIPEDVRRSLIEKMDRLEHMIQTMEAPYRKKRHYYGMLDETISQTVKSYIASISPDTLTAMELLDIKEFDKSRKVNGMFSVFARGKLQAALKEELNWKGYDFAEVEPAYTSRVCPVCGNLDSANRNGKVFKCTCCGYEDDADRVAGINIRDRAGDKEIAALCEKHKYSTKDRQAALRELYASRHETYLNKQHPEPAMAAV